LSGCIKKSCQPTINFPHRSIIAKISLDVSRHRRDDCDDRKSQAAKEKSHISTFTIDAENNITSLVSPQTRSRAERSKFGRILFDLAQIRLSVSELAILLRPIGLLVLYRLIRIIFSVQPFVIRNHILILALNTPKSRNAAPAGNRKRRWKERLWRAGYFAMR
jgi:hypothetical protein